MKMKRIISALIVICMLLSVIPTVSVSAATEWEYEVGIVVSQKKDAFCAKKNAIMVKLKFTDNSEEYALLADANKSPTSVVFKTSKAPWTVNGVELENSTKDSFWMHQIKVEARKSGDSYGEILLLNYPGGNPNDPASGKPIDQDDGGPANYSVSFDARRDVFDRDDYTDQLNKTFTLNPLGESGTLKKEWSGKVKDTYTKFFSSSTYDCMDLSDPPTLSVSVSGRKEDGSQVSKGVLEDNGVKFLEKGYEVDRAKLLAYMNDNNMAQIQLKFTLSFPEKSAKNKTSFNATTKINRSAVCAESVNYSRNYYYVDADNRYYNNSSGNTVIATVKLKSTEQFNLYAAKLRGKSVEIGEAYLTAGDGIKIAANEKSVKTNNTDSFNLTFALPDNVSSDNTGLRLVLNNTYLIWDANTKYALWDGANKKQGLSLYTSAYKIDRENPHINIVPEAGTELSKWNKTITVNATPNETIYSFENQQQKGYSTMYLYGNGTYPVIYKYNYTEQNPGTASAFQKVPSMKDFEQKITLALCDRVEGEYRLIFVGWDEAGNQLSSIYEGIKLDNKPPEVSITETQRSQASDGTKGNVYDVKISDASGTGRFYYMFTEKSRNDAPAFEDTQADKASGDMDTTLDKWAYVEQRDTENGKTAAAYLSVAKGKNFNGRILYFGMDEAGNKTEVFEKTINIQNENTAYDITPKNVDKPLSSYNITIDTNKNNTVYYRWKNTQDNSYISDFIKYSGGIDTSKDEATKKLNGVYTLECKIVPPSNTNINYTSLNYVFDNEGPQISFSLPSAAVGRETQTVSVYATDASEVKAATAKIVTPDGQDIEGYEKFGLNIENGILSQNLNIFDVPSGAYAIQVTAEDTNGIANTGITEAFLIRNAAPNGTVYVKSDLSHNDKPLALSESIELEFDITEEFSNASYAKGQVIYYRTGTASGEYGQWTKACGAEVSGNEITATTVLELTKISLADGENTLFVQTAVCGENDDLSKIGQNSIKTDELTFYYDNTAPEADIVIEDVQTNENIEGKIYVSDNLNGEIFIACASSAVQIGNITDGEADITVSENTDTVVTVSDASGNKTNAALVICGIDKTPPTAEIMVAREAHGERYDAKATVKVNDVLGETVKFAFIPTDKYSGGDIPEEYFEENLSDVTHFKTSVARTEAAVWDGENNITYNARIVGITGEWYLGVRAADSLGNSCDIVFTDNKLSAEDVTLTQSTVPRLKRTENRTIVDTKYNMCVYTLPQDKILDANSDAVKNNTFKIDGFDLLSEMERVETANLALAKQYAMTYSDTYSFAAENNGSYDLYTADDLGRTKHLTAVVEGVEFGAAGNSNIKLTRYTEEWEQQGDYYVQVKKPVTDDEMICAVAQQCFVLVEPADSNADTLFMPIPELDGDYINGLSFNESASEEYAERDDNDALLGYSKLWYNVNVQYDSQISYIPVEVTDRVLSVRAFSRGADYTDPNQVSDKTVLISKVDNTEPKVTMSVNPEVFTYEDVTYDGGAYKERVNHPTPGNVTFTLSGQDKESGIGSIIVLQDDCCGEVSVPMTDEDGNPTEYWSWSGNGHYKTKYVWDESTQSEIEKQVPIPVTIEYFGDGDRYGIKTLKYTFTDAYSLDYAQPAFVNTLGGRGMYIDYKESKISTEGIIYKIPIEENTDFNVKYYYLDADEKWTEIEDIQNTYYKNAKAVIEIPEGGRGAERGLYVSNNSRQNEKALSNYQNEFTFKLKDKYGYTKDVTVSLDNFDTESGTIDYRLAVNGKTNKPYDVTITVSDSGSGIGKVVLSRDGNEILLSKAEEGQYKGTVSQNGTYSITLYDKVGNKAVKSFNVKNIDTVKPTASVTYSTEEYTSRPVSATIAFSKQNVRITGVEPTTLLTAADYSVNYGTSTIIFTKSGSADIYFEDDYGNSGVQAVTVKNIDKTPPVLEAVQTAAPKGNSVSVSFNKLDVLTSEMDMARSEEDIYVTYGGITKPVADGQGNKSSFEFAENGDYTFKVHDKEGMSSYLSIEITDIDTAAPKITSVSWSYDYDEFDTQKSEWITKRASESVEPKNGTAGYIVASDQYKVTNGDVNVTVKTDGETRLVGGDDNYTTSKEKTYTRNGLFIFNAEKRNGLVSSYGVDIEIIDKTPPVIDLLDKNEFAFYENPKMNTEYDISMLKYIPGGKYEAYKAYDVFGGKKTELTQEIEIDWGGFNPDDLSKNTFDSSKPYTITYRVTDAAHNTFETKRTVRLVGLYDTVALVNGELPDFAGRREVRGDKIRISLSNFAGTAYVRYQKGIYTMGQMKKLGAVLNKNENGEFETPKLEEGWYTFFIQTDKRDYFTLCAHLSE